MPNICNQFKKLQNAVLYYICADLNLTMDFITIIAVALGLSFDTFAVSLSLGIVRNKILFRQAIPVALVLAIFQSGFLIIGFFLGSIISDIVKAADHWIALVLLGVLGVKMTIEGIRGRKRMKLRIQTAL